MEVLSSEPAVKVSEVLEKIAELAEGKVGHPARSLNHRYFHVFFFQVKEDYREKIMVEKLADWVDMKGKC